MAIQISLETWQLRPRNPPRTLQRSANALRAGRCADKGVRDIQTYNLLENCYSPLDTEGAFGGYTDDPCFLVRHLQEGGATPSLKNTQYG